MARRTQTYAIRLAVEGGGFPGEGAANGREPLVVDLGEEVRQRRARRRRCDDRAKDGQGQGRGA